MRLQQIVRFNNYGTRQVFEKLTDKNMKNNKDINNEC